MKHLLSIADLSRDEIVGLMDEADRFREALLDREVKKLPTLRGRTIFTMFYENSTRTRASFETAGKWMSADVINVSSSGSSVKKGESLKDTAAALTAVKQLMPLHGQPLQARQQRGRKPGILRIRQLLTQHAVSLRKLTPRLVLVQPAFLPEKKLLQRLPLRLIRGDKLLFLHTVPSMPRK